MSEELNRIKELRKRTGKSQSKFGEQFISYYEDYLNSMNEFKARVCEDEDGKYIIVSFEYSDEIICIQEGMRKQLSILGKIKAILFICITIEIYVNLII